MSLHTMSIKFMAYRLFMAVTLAAALVAPVAGAALRHQLASSTHSHPVTVAFDVFGGGGFDTLADGGFETFGGQGFDALGSVEVEPLGYTWGA